MHFSKSILAILPAMAYAQAFNNSSIVWSTPTFEELQSAYPDVFTSDMAESARHVNGYLAVDTADATTVSYRVAAGTLSAIGYYSLAGGCDQVVSTYKACTDSSGSGFECAARAVSAASAHILVAGAGFIGGKQFILYFWHGGALQAAGLPTGTKRIRQEIDATDVSCNANQQRYYSTARFSGNYGMKIAGKDMSCYSSNSADMSQTSSLASDILAGMGDPGRTANSCSMSTQFTVYGVNNNRVEARYHLQLDTTPDNVCPFTITGGNSCTA